MNKKIIYLIVILAVFFGGIAALYMLRGETKPAPQNQTGTEQMIVTYFCKEGTIVAEFKNNTVTLGLSDGRSFDLPIAPSGSGIRYEKGKMLFVGKGSNASFQENGMTIYTDCLAGTQTSAKGINSFADASHTFTFSYPNSFTLSGGEAGYTTLWTSNSSQSGMILAKVVIPRSFQNNTNFGEATFTVGTSSDTEAIKNCLMAENGVSGTPIDINGFPFTKIKTSDAGAGNFYDTTAYRIIRNDQCYSVEYTIHSANIGNFAPEQHIAQFDKEKVESALFGIVSSFKFFPS